MSAPRLPGVIYEGERDVQLTSMAGTMRRRGMSPESVLQALLIENEVRCVPPLPAKQVHKIARSSKKWEPSASLQDLEREAELERLNETYAVLQMENNVVILQERSDEIFFLNRSDFKLLLQNRYVETPPDANGVIKRVPLSDRWVKWEGRREYTALVFEPSALGEPGVASEPGVYNLWRGWAVEPSAVRGAGRCDLFLKHLRYVVCRDRDHYEWFLDWLADLFQNPRRKLGIVVALRGPQGAGKTIVGDALKKLLGRYQIVVEKPDQITGRFNGHLAYNLLLQAEEAFWAGDRRGAAVLKHLVTGATQQIERKGIDSVEMPSYTRLLITTNSRWVWPTDLDDRRLVIFDISGKHRNDHDYFAAMVAQLEDGGYEKLLHQVLTRDIDEKRLRRDLPRTKAFEEQVIHSMEPEEIWLLGLLKSGRLPGGRVDAAGNAHVRTGELRDHYLSTQSARHPLNAEQFGIFLSHRLPKVEGVKPRCRSRFYDSKGRTQQSQRRVIAPLVECRAAYEQRGRGAPDRWSKKRRWSVED